MKKEQISEALSFIDDDMLEETNKLRMAPRSEKAKKPHKVSYIKVIKYASFVAAAALVIVVGVKTIGSVRGGKMSSADSFAPSSSKREYRATSAPMATQAPGAAEVYSAGDVDDNSDNYNDYYSYEEPLAIPTLNQLTNGNDNYDEQQGANDIPQNDGNGLDGNGSENAATGRREEDGGAVGDFTTTRSEKESASETVITAQSEIVYTVLEEKDDSRISFIITNNMSESISCSPEWALEVLVEDVWYEVESGMADTENWAGLLEFKPGESMNFSYLESIYSTLSAGKYRIVQSFTVKKKGPGDDDYIVLGLCFEVK